jgi:hypothetical protein
LAHQHQCIVCQMRPTQKLEERSAKHERKVRRTTDHAGIANC